MHPTAAVGGTPRERAAAVIGELEGMARGRLFAGCGIVRGSDPAEELAETQAKFAAFQAALES